MAVSNELDRYFAQEDGGEQAQPVEQPATQTADDLSAYFDRRAEEQPQPEEDLGIEKYFAQQEVDRPSRAGAIGRAVAEEFLPATAAGLAVKGISSIPVPAVPKFLLGATGAILSAGAAGRLQEEAAKKIAGEKAVEEFKAQRQRDIQAYPVSTFAASALTPTAGAILGVGRKGLTATGQAIRGAFTKAEAVAPKVEQVAPKVEAAAEGAISSAEEVPVKTFYHGSPSSQIEELKPDTRGLVFMSESKDVASSYKASRTKNVDLSKAGLTDEEIKSYRAYKNAIANQPEIDPQGLLSGKQFDEASSALEKLDQYERVLAAQGRVYEISIPTSKLIDYREGNAFYETLKKVRDDLYAKDEKRLGNIVQNAIFNKIPPQSRFLDKPFFDSLKKQGIEGITLPHSKEGTETMVVQGVIRKPVGAVPKVPSTDREKLIQELKQRAGPEQKVRATAERMIADPRTSDELAAKFADKRNRALYNTFSPKTLAKELRQLTPEARSAIAASDDLTGETAKFVSMEDARLAGDAQAADSFFDTIYGKLTNAAQMMNLGKLINTSPEGYAYILNKTLLKATRKFATQKEKDLIESGAKITPALRQEAIELFTKKQAAEDAMREAWNKARTDFSKKAEEIADQRQTEALLASGELANFEGKLLAKELGMQLPDYIRGNLLTTLSQGANILGNTVNMPTRAATRQVASLLDQIERNIIRPVATRIPGVKGVAEKYLAKERQFMSPLGRGSLERFIEVGKGGGRGLKEGVYALKTGVSPEGLLAGEGVRGFRPLNAWKQLFTGKGLAEPIAEGMEGTAAKVMDRARLLAEGTLGIPPEVMFRLLQLGDTPARRMAQARLLTEARQLEGLKGEALRRAVKYPTQLEVDRVASEVAEAVYQQDTKLSRGIQYLAELAPKYLEKIPGVGRPLAGVARTATTAVLPYQKTPTNVIDEILQYSIPEYSFIRGLAEQGQGNFRQAKLQFAKSIVGYAIGNVADILSKAGVITDEIPKSDKARDVQFQAAPAKMINIDGVKRFLETGSRQEMEPGDSLRSLERLGVVGAIMSTRNAANQATEGGTESAGEAWGATLPETLKFGFNQSFLRNMNSLLGTVSRGEAKDMDAWLANYYGALSAAVLPNQLTSVSRYMSENMPDKIQVKDIEGGDFGAKSYNIFKEVVKRKWPGSAEDLPSRINVWGEPVPQTPEGVDPFIYNFIDPTRPRKVTYDDVTLAVYDLYKKTGKTEGIPQVPDRDLQVLKRRTGQRARFRLDPLLYEEYASAVGKANRQVAEQLLGDKRFRRLIPEEQVKTLSNAYNKASKTARENFIRKNQRSIEFGQEL